MNISIYHAINPTFGMTNPTGGTLTKVWARVGQQADAHCRNFQTALVLNLAPYRG